MADLKAMFIIMLMINIGVMIIFQSGAIPDTLQAGREANKTLSDYFSSGSIFDEAGAPTQSDIVNQTVEWGKPITYDSETEQTILRTDNPLRMITKGLTMILGSMFGVLYVLISLQAPLFVVWLIGVPFTLIYMIAGVMFIRGVN